VSAVEALAEADNNAVSTDLDEQTVEDMVKTIVLCKRPKLKELSWWDRGGLSWYARRKESWRKTQIDYMD